MTSASTASNLVRRHALATAGVFAAILQWSTTIAVSRSLSEAIGAMGTAAVVYTVVGGMAAVRLWLNPDDRRQIWQLPRGYLGGCGALFVAYILFLYLAIGLAADRQQVLEIGLLNYLWPVMTLLLSVLVLRKRASMLLLVPGTLLALVGVLLVISHQTVIIWPAFLEHLASNLAAYLLGLAAAVAWGLYSVLARKLACGSNAGGAELFISATAVTFIGVALVAPEVRHWSWRVAAEALFLGSCTYAAYRLWDSAMRTGNIVRVAAGSYLTPLLSTIASCLYFCILPGARLWLGCAVLSAGSLLSWRAVRED